MPLPDLPPSEAPEGEVHYSRDPMEGGLTTPLTAAGGAIAAAPPRPPREAIDTRLVRRLADILKDTDLSEIEVERGDLKIRVARAAAVAAPTLVAAPMVQAALPLAPSLAPSASAAPPPNPAAPPAEGETLRGEVVKSPMVGAVYLQPQPGAKRFVTPGEQVAAGQTLLIIEAMKTMNPIPAPRAGTILRVLVEDGQPVEFGEPLVVIE